MSESRFHLSPRLPPPLLGHPRRRGAGGQPVDRPNRPRRRQRRDQDRPDRLRRSRHRRGGQLPRRRRALKLVAVADAFADRAEGCLELAPPRLTAAERSTSPTTAIFVGFDAYQKAIDCGVDLVILATPPGFRPIHYRGGRRSRQARLHGEARARRRPRLSARCMAANKLAEEEEPEGRRRPAAPPPDRATSRRIKRIHDGAIGDIAVPPRLLERRRRLGPPPQARARPRWSTRCATGTTSSGSAATTSSSSTSTTSTSATGCKDAPSRSRPSGMGGRQVRKSARRRFGQIFDHHAVEFTYADGTKMFSQTTSALNVRLLVRNKNKVQVSIGDLVEIQEGSTFDKESLAAALTWG